MLPILYVICLISCSALAKSKNEALSVRRDPGIISQSESLNSLMDGHGNDLLKARPNIIFCCVCQEAIKQAKEKVYQKMTQNINLACYKFIEAFRKKCLQYAVKYRDIILHKLFPANGYRSAIMRALFPGRTIMGTCRVLKLCARKKSKKCS